MRRLILFFVQYGGFFAFCALELFSLYLVVQFNQKQNEIYHSSENRWVGAMHESSDYIFSYFNLRPAADSLARENATLRNQFRNLKQPLPTTDFTTNNTDSSLQYQFIAARVINNSVNRNNNSLTLNRGSKDSIEAHMGVLGSNGIVGVVRNVSHNYARVMSLLHRQTRISAAVRRNGYFGSLVWESSNPTKMSLRDIPKHADISIGDTVQTSGYSTLFPADVLIGKIDTFWLDPGSNYFDIQVSLFNDLSNIKYVYVVKNHRKKELEQLEEQFADE